ncbi:putative Zinc finger, RING-type [Helianthus annuus]|uniref:Putative zinc finger, RING/FYVE/PHD-type n=1 Tax=Helianthus annuus TaxID=4232 RepID=A0A251S1A3_HELAN|nr:uncharacterized protein LOC110916598 [Helianthus annuus]KAF5761305.1 putative Zinc finger, RING-type [Helianthus annuus]KAJ0444207.1 putative Zinc finger, RING-type [Helianthus annuus]KAJ0822408.1 putative Zinc finger, RING-type [Helianthus annuus]
MNNDQIVANFSTIISIILTNKSTILITVIAVTLLRYILKTLHNRRQFPILTVKQTATKPVYCTVCLYDVVKGQRYRRLPKCHHCFHLYETSGYGEPHLQGDGPSRHRHVGVA